MSITPSPVPRPEREPSAENRVPAAQTGGGGSVSRLPVILLAVLILVGLGGLFLFSYQLNNRLEEMKSSFDRTLSSQSEILRGLNQRLDQADERYAALQGEFAVTKERLGLTQSELARARQISSELAKEQKESTAQLTSQLSGLQQEQVATEGSVGILATDVDEVKEEVKATQEQLASTRTELQGVKG